MRVLIVVDKENSAIGRLALMVQKYSNENIEIVAIHPKRESEQNLVNFRVMAENADIIDFQYWKTATMLLKRFPELREKISILAHHNPYNILEEDWKPYQFNAIVANNETLYNGLEQGGYTPRLIRLCVDFDEFNYNEDRDYDTTDVCMVAARIEGKKGIKEVAQVCKELGYNFHLVGRPSKPDYLHEVIQEGAIYHQDVTDAEIKDVYNKCAVHVCNSVDNFESGTMPILESMACGLPVLTRNIGHVPDISDGKNLVIRFGSSDDKENLKNELKTLVESQEQRKELSVNGYRSAIYYSAELRAREYSKLYRKLMYPKQETVSVIIPTVPDREENLQKIVRAYLRQTYKNIEIIICQDTEEGYNLAKMRNEGAIQALGEILVFSDDRLLPDKDAVEKFVINLKSKSWLFGNKDNSRKVSFVENFSCVYRREFINGGMCCERINEYGGMSQEIRERFGSQGVRFEFIEEVKAKSIHSTHGMAGRLRSIKRMKIKLRKMYE